MQLHTVGVQPPGQPLPTHQQLAWKLAKVATDPVPVAPDVEDMIVNRIIDNAGVGIAALGRAPVECARAQALAHCFSAGNPGGASLFGLPAAARVAPEWAAWANGTAVRELDFHDTYLAADYAHPGDTIPPLIAVAEHCGCSGAELLRAIAAAYEVHVALVRAIALHPHKIDHIAHLTPAVAAGLGALLGLATPVVYQAIQQGVHVSTTTRQSRKGAISSWKAFAPAHAGKLAIEAVDRAMRGQGAPSPIYEGEDGVIAWLLDGKDAVYKVALPAPGEAKRAILETYTKQHSAEYQAQAFIDLARKMRPLVSDLNKISSIVLHTSHHTHQVIGTGAGDVEKMDPKASRETLDHSLMYIFAVALEDGIWHHEKSYAPARARRAETVRLWGKITTVEDPQWTRAYHAPDPSARAFGGRAVITMNDGSTITESLSVADAHPNGAHPFRRADYIEKFKSLAVGRVTTQEQARVLETMDRLAHLKAGELHTLNPQAGADAATDADAATGEGARGIFDFHHTDAASDTNN